MTKYAVFFNHLYEIFETLCQGVVTSVYYGYTWSTLCRSPHPFHQTSPPRWQCQLASVHLFVACERGLWRPSCGVYVVIIIHLIVFGWLSLTKLLYKQHPLNLNFFDYISQFILIACSIILCICNYTLLNFHDQKKHNKNISIKYSNYSNLTI